MNDLLVTLAIGYRSDDGEMFEDLTEIHGLTERMVNDNPTDCLRAIIPSKTIERLKEGLDLMYKIPSWGLRSREKIFFLDDKGNKYEETIVLRIGAAEYNDYSFELQHPETSDYVVFEVVNGETSEVIEV